MSGKKPNPVDGLRESLQECQGLVRAWATPGRHYTAEADDDARRCQRAVERAEDALRGSLHVPAPVVEPDGVKQDAFAANRDNANLIVIHHDDCVDGCCERVNPDALDTHTVSNAPDVTPHVHEPAGPGEYCIGCFDQGAVWAKHEERARVRRIVEDARRIVDSAMWVCDEQGCGAEQIVEAIMDTLDAIDGGMTDA